MGKVFSWKLMAITSSDQSEWAGPIYSWLSAPGEPSNSTEITGNFDDSYLIASKNYAKKLTTIEAYRAAFERMRQSLPIEYLCASGLRNAEDYFNDDCEWGGEKRWCGVAESIEEGVEEFSVSPLTSYGDSFTFKFVGKNTGSVDFYLDGSEVTPSYENCVTVERDTICVFSGTVTANEFGTHSISYETENGYTDSKQVERREISLSFSQTTASVGFNTTEYSFTYTAVPSSTITIDKGDCTDYTVNGNRVTVFFPQNTGYEPVGYTVSGTLSAGGQTKYATLEIEQAAEARYLHWVETSPQSVPASQQQKTLHYETNLNTEHIVIESSNSSVFRVGTPGASSVVISFSGNESEDPRSTTLTLRSSYTASETLVLTQEGHEEPQHIPSLTLNPSGTIFFDRDIENTAQITATTEWCHIADNEIYLEPSNCKISFSVQSNTTSVSSASGTALINIHFDGYAVDTSGNISINKNGYVTNYANVDCGMQETEAQLFKQDLGFTLTVNARDEIYDVQVQALSIVIN